MRLMDHRFLFVIGKGGVGKTTVAAALGLAAAREGKRVLLAMVNTKERLSALLDVPPIDHTVRQVAPNLDAVNMTPAASLEEYGLMILKVRVLYNAVFDNRLVRAFLRGTPGMEAWAMLGKAFYHAVGKDESTPGEYDLVILDAPATGHGLDMIRVPQVICDVAPKGLLRREAERALSLFRDPTQSGALLVTLPEDMPTNETIELNAALAEMRIPVPGLVINQVLPRLFKNSHHDTARLIGAALPHASPIATLAEAARVRAFREAVQQQSLARLAAELDTTQLRLPHLFAPEFGRDQINSLSHIFS